jgi:hypothetical protein
MLKQIFPSFCRLARWIVWCFQTKYQRHGKPYRALKDDNQIDFFDMQW